jgi:cell division protein FtsN
MEQQQRILVIIVSVSLFVAVVIGAALLFTYPGDEQEMARAEREGGTGSEGFDPIEYLNEPDRDEPELQTREQREREDSRSDSGDVIIVYGQRDDGRSGTDRSEGADRAAADEPNGRADEGPPAAAAEQAGQQRAQQAGQAQAQQQQRSRPEADTAPAQQEQRTRPESDTASAAGRRDRAAQPERAAEAERRRTAPEPSAESRVAARQPAQERERTRRSATNYWIQVISSPNLGLVRDAQETLEQNRLGSRITTTDVEGQNYFRLRVGPYDNEQEAEKFLGWVKEIEGFESSYISETYFRM